MTLVKKLSEVGREYQEWATSDHPRLGIGYDIMDTRTNGGAAVGEVILFQARSQVGKTTFALNVVENMQVPTVVFSLEMNARYILPRLAAIHTNTPTVDIENQVKAGLACPAMQQTLNDFGPILVVPDEPAMSIKVMQSALEEAASVLQAEPQFVVIDFLELIGGVPSLSTVDKIDGLTRKVKDFARKNDVVVLLLHQVGREAGGAGNEPLDITSSRYGGEVSADYVLGAYRPCLRPGISQDDYMRERWFFYLQFLKTRGGSELHPAGLPHMFDPATMRIHNGYPEVPLFAGDDLAVAGAGASAA